MISQDGGEIQQGPHVQAMLDAQLAYKETLPHSFGKIYPMLSYNTRGLLALLPHMLHASFPRPLNIPKHFPTSPNLSMPSTALATPYPQPHFLGGLVLTPRPHMTKVSTLIIGHTALLK